jgi:DNA invertase Pin-like site-specific DNA recombinase
MIIGYARVSSKDQNPERQLQQFKELGIEDRFIFVDYASGKDFNRPKYQLMRSIIRAGDLVYIDALDRLGRDYDGIISEWKYITRTLNADIVVLENPSLFDSRKFKEMGDFGKLLEDQFLALMSYAAERERKRIRLKQAEGIEIALKNGKKLGRPPVQRPKNWDIVYKQWIENKITAVEAMKKLNLKKSTFYKFVKEDILQNE